MVFVGGCTTNLLVTDPAAPEVRVTADVDVVIEVESRIQYYAFSDKLKELGFKEDTREKAPLCRWLNKEVTLDVMPDDEAILGFSNRWFTRAIQTAEVFNLEEGLAIRVITAPYFVGTKLEAFKGRGKDDLALSNDLEDLISVIDGRPTLVREINHANEDLRDYVRSEMQALLNNSDFVDALPGFLPQSSQDRLPILMERLQALAAV